MSPSRVTGDRAAQLAERILQARLAYSMATKSKVSQEALGALVSERLGREQRITGATVSRWESGGAVPDLATVEAIAEVCGVDPGWLAFGEKSAAPAPR
jgi:transcriptional regulator with XRE-family HTH domain